MSEIATNAMETNIPQAAGDKADLAKQLLRIIPPVMQTLAAELRRTGQLLSPSHFGVLVMLHLQTCNLSELAEHHGVSLPTMSSTVSRLEERGWVQRERDEHDRRVVKVRLTTAGKRKLLQISELAESRLVVILGTLSTGEQSDLARGLAVLDNLFGMADLTSNFGNEDAGCD